GCELQTAGMAEVGACSAPSLLRALFPSTQLNGELSMARVLCTGIYASLRKIILESGGHVVITAPDESTLLAACRFHSFDVAIVGHQGSAGDKKEWLTVIRKYCPAAKVLEIYVAHENVSLPDADDWLETPVTNYLSDRVSELAAKQKRS